MGGKKSYKEKDEELLLLGPVVKDVKPWSDHDTVYEEAMTSPKLKKGWMKQNIIYG